MYTQIRKAGFRHFLYVIGAAAIAELVISYIRYLFPLHKLFTDILMIAVFMIIGYTVFTHYTSVFEYKTDGEKLYISRKIGSRTKTFQIDVKRIKKITQNKSEANLPKKSPNMCCSVFSKKNVYYVVYRENKQNYGLIFEPDEEFLSTLKRLGNGGKND